jgi:hypothetical protein
MSKPDILENLQQYAINKGGLLLSTSYTNQKEKLEWQCEKGHIFNKSWDSVKYQNQWCPECASFNTENTVRKLLENKFGFDFKKTRFICGDQRLEFDGYNEEHKIAFEYQGYQHYIYPNRFHKTIEQFEKQQQNDRTKKQYCIENGIHLIEISHTEARRLKKYIDTLNINN